MQEILCTVVSGFVKRERIKKQRKTAKKLQKDSTNTAGSSEKTAQKGRNIGGTREETAANSQEMFTRLFCLPI